MPSSRQISLTETPCSARFRAPMICSSLYLLLRMMTSWSGPPSCRNSSYPWSDFKGGGQPDYAFLGWDVAICGNGPVMLEANGNFGASGLQKSGPNPLIDEKFLAVFDYWRNKSKANRLKGERVNG